VDYAPFAGDRLAAGWRAERAALLEALGEYCRAHGLALDKEQIHGLDDAALLHAIAAALPLHPAEKQALLEAGTLAEREQVLIGLLQMGGEAAAANDAAQTPVN
jgi:Lon protease-like protein